jgi:hypothetical protein
MDNPVDTLCRQDVIRMHKPVIVHRPRPTRSASCEDLWMPGPETNRSGAGQTIGYPQSTALITTTTKFQFINHVGKATL